MDHPHLFFTAFGDELDKLASTGSPLPELAKQTLKHHGKDIATLGAGAGLLYAGQRMHKDWKLGKQLRKQQERGGY